MLLRVTLTLCLVLAFAGTQGAADDKRGLSADQAVALVERSFRGEASASRLFVGAEICLACHPTKAGWKRSLHATGFKEVANDAFSLKQKDGIVADYDANGVDDFKQGLDLNKISSAFDAYKPNAPILSYQAGKGYGMQIGQVVFPVMFAYGGTGRYKQRYVLKIPVTDRPNRLSAGHYVSPLQYNDATREYVTYDPLNWWNADGSPKFTPASMAKDAATSTSFDRGCAGCHFTSISVGKDANGEFVASAPPVVLYEETDTHYYDFNGDGVKEHFNIGCERCHGPGGDHVLGRGDPGKILHPARELNAKQSNELCTSCHNRGKSKPNAVFDYPFDETANTGYVHAIGEDVTGRFFTERGGMWPNGTESSSHRQQGIDFRRSRMTTAGVRCLDCHDVHIADERNVRKAMAVRDSAGRFISVPTKFEDNTLCLACHSGRGPFRALRREDLLDMKTNEARIGVEVSKHTFHSYAPDRAVGLSRCRECHMAKFARTAVAYDIASHTFAVVPPEATITTAGQGGMPNSCTVRCHRPLAPFFGLPADPTLTRWNEASDIALANFLRAYYGPNGVWWKTRP